MAETILLTGATGYLGGYLSKAFLDMGYNLISLCLNEKENYRFKDNKNVRVYYLDKTPLDKIFEENKLNIVVHTATLYGRSNETITAMIGSNIVFPVTILTLAEKYGIDLFINTDTILVNNISPYAMTKSNFRDWLSIFEGKFKIANLRLDHFYGPNDKPTKFIAWLIEQMKKNVDKIDLTDGSQTRDFIYIKDVVEAYTLLVKSRDKLQSDKINNFEVGTNIKTPIKKMVNLIYNEIKPKNTVLNFGAVPYRKNEVLDYDIDTSKLRLLGWAPKYTVEYGIKEIIEIEGI